MKTFFSPNIDGTGRWVRVVYGCGLVVAGGLFWRANHHWLGGGLILFGGFAWLEAARGWCIVRACGIKTKI